MALDAEGTADKLYKALKEITDNATDEESSVPEGKFMEDMTKIFDDAFQEATPMFNNIDLSIAKGTLSLTGSDSGTPAAGAAFAAGVATYFGLCIVPGKTPGIPGATAVVMVINTAPLIIPILVAAIPGVLMDTMDKIAAMEDKSEDEIISDAPPFLDFVNLIFDTVKTITWIAIELVPVGPAVVPTPIPVTIS